jgi:hypothetical protein
MIKPIETSYRGYKTRSRTEARWMIYFDSICISWIYEPQGYILDGNIPYLPDFYFPELKVFCEVKPEGGFAEEALNKIRLLVMGTGKECILLESIPDVRSYKAIKPNLDKPNDLIEEFILLFPHPEEQRLYRCEEEMSASEIEESAPEIFAHLKRSCELALSARFGENPGQQLATPQQQLQQEQLAGQSSDRENPLFNKSCTQAEIDSYWAFASLPLSERRRRVYSNYITLYPNSPLTKDVLSGKIDLLKPKKPRKPRTKRNPKVSKKTQQLLLQIEPSSSVI